MIVDSHQHVMLPTSMQIKKMDDARVDKAILFTTTPHVERAATATLDAIGAEMQVLYKLLSGSYSPEARIHMGGSNWMDVIAFAKEHGQAYLDLSAAFTPLSVKTALTEVPEKCLFGSDAPFGEPQLCRQLIEFVSPSLSVTELALGGNIERLLQI